MNLKLNVIRLYSGDVVSTSCEGTVHVYVSSKDFCTPQGHNMVAYAPIGLDKIYDMCLEQTHEIEDIGKDAWYHYDGENWIKCGKKHKKPVFTDFSTHGS